MIQFVMKYVHIFPNSVSTTPLLPIIAAGNTSAYRQRGRRGVDGGGGQIRSVGGGGWGGVGVG
jgi:hypothetical protein